MSFDPHGEGNGQPSMQNPDQGYDLPRRFGFSSIGVRRPAVKLRQRVVPINCAEGEDVFVELDCLMSISSDLFTYEVVTRKFSYGCTSRLVEVNSVPEVPWRWLSGSYRLPDVSPQRFGRGAFWRGVLSTKEFPVHFDEKLLGSFKRDLFPWLHKRNKRVGWLPAGKEKSSMGLPCVAARTVDKTDRVDSLSASELLEQQLMSKSGSNIRWNVEHQAGCRLRRRAKWVNLLQDSLGLPRGLLASVLHGRWNPDLTMERGGEGARLSALLSVGAKFLGGGTARVKPLSPSEVKDGVQLVETPFVRLGVRGQPSGVVVYPELVAKLGALMVFRERDHDALSLLKLRALEWCKSRRILDLDMLEGMPMSVALACSSSLPEQAATRVLEDMVQVGKPERALKGGVSGGWFGGWGSTLPSGLLPGWWRKKSTV